MCSDIIQDDLKTTKLKSATINYLNLQGKDYSWNLGKLLGKEEGIAYITFKYASKNESDVVVVNCPGEKTSPAIETSNVVVENRFSGTSEKVYVTVNNLESGDTVYIYKKAANNTYAVLGSLISSATGTVTGNYTKTTELDKVYLTQKKKNQLESVEKQEFAVPMAGTTTFGVEGADFPVACVIAKDQTGQDIVEISGVGSGTIVTFYKDSLKKSRIKRQTINTSGSISVTNILSYGTIYVTFRAPDKYESLVIPVVPIPAVETSLLYDSVRLENNAGTNDTIKFSNLMYTEEEYKKINVAFTVYSDESKTSKLYSGTIPYGYLQGNKDYSVSIGKKLGENSGTAYLSFKYTTKKESELYPIAYEEEKYSPNISLENVSTITKYTGTSEKVYFTVNNLQSGDIVYVYKLLASGSYSQILSATCTAASDSVAFNFANPADADHVYLQLKRTNQYIAKDKTMVGIPAAGITTWGGDGSDLPDLSI